MRKNILKTLALAAPIAFGSCDFVDDFKGEDDDTPISGLHFIDEYVIPDGEIFQNTLVGGLSGIDYALGSWYLISDDPEAPIRFYTANIDFDRDGFNEVALNAVTELKDADGMSFEQGTVDPEAIRIMDNMVIWTSEGNINNSVDPFVRKAELDGTFVSEAGLNDRFSVSMDDNVGPRQNGTFEGVSLSTDGTGYWVAMELPLRQDGPAPMINDTNSPVRLVFIDEATGESGREYAYELDPVVRPATNGTSFEINGVVELLQVEKDKFFVLERSFATGYADGGNNVRIYEVDVSLATDVSNRESLQETPYNSVSKKLLFDFESIRGELTGGVVDNIEGITFGPNFANGNRSLVLVADNNFSAFGPQLNQFVLFELVD
ncbi:MAG: esterase-like activity of phytase family protein [Bacteroidota bacterium]